MVATVGGSWNKVFLWDVGTGELLDELEEHETIIDILEYSMDGRYIAVSGQYGQFSIFDVEKKQKMYRKILIRYGSPDYDEIEQITNNIKSMLFSPDGERLVVTFYRWIFCHRYGNW